jgi:hypothetical protein
MTSIEWFFNELQRMQYFIGNDMLESYKQAKEMHKQEMKEMYLKGIENYDPTFKRKDETLKDYHIVDTNEMVELPQQEISDNSPKEVKKDSFGEISDEEIMKAANEYADVYQCPSEVKMCKHDVISAWNNAIKWYREQLKKKQ